MWVLLTKFVKYLDKRLRVSLSIKSHTCTPTKSVKLKGMFLEQHLVYLPKLFFKIALNLFQRVNLLSTHMAWLKHALMERTFICTVVGGGVGVRLGSYDKF